MSLIISVKEQNMTLRTDGCEIVYPVSTGLNGVGQQEGSGQTPLGKHFIHAKIGGDSPLGAVFVGRRWTGEVYTPELAQAEPNRDWILSRILWLCGAEPGVNRGGNVDTQRRYIYIHGTPDEDQIGQPVSHGCIRMRNADVVELYDLVNPAISVTITR
jgi:lipoprotein-anchoring transpeptidase ErfK/SrfK